MAISIQSLARVLPHLSDPLRSSLIVNNVAAHVAQRRKCGLDADITTYLALFPYCEAQVVEGFALAEDRVAPPTSRAQLLEELELGSGAFGQVLEAVDDRRELVAIKVFHRRAPAKVKEGGILLRLQDQMPGVVRVRAIYQTDDDRTLLVMEHLGRRSLESAIDRLQPDVLSVIDIAATLADTVAGLHEHGLCHGDIKPSNVMLTDTRGPVLIDFGSAITERADVVLAATQAYASPEVQAAIDPAFQPIAIYDNNTRVVSEPAPHLSDIWSLGIIIYNLLSGRLPFVGDTPFELSKAIILRDPIRIDVLNPSLATLFPGLADICHKCLRKVPQDRYGTARELAIALRGVQAVLTERQQAIVRRHKMTHSLVERAVSEHATFAGYNFVLPQIERFTSTHDRGTVVINGPAGIGKSAIWADLVRYFRRKQQHRPIAYSFKNSLGLGTPSLFFEYVSNELVSLYGGSFEDSAMYNTLVARLLTDVASKVSPREPQMLFIDAADECLADPREPYISWLADILPQGVYLVVATRSGHDLLPSSTTLVINLSDGDYKTLLRANVNSYICNDCLLPTGTLRNQVVQTSDGHMLIAQLLRRLMISDPKADVAVALRNSATRTAFEDLGPVLDSIWKKVPVGCDKDLKDTLLDIVAVLASTDFALTRQMLCDVLPGIDDDTVMLCLDRLCALLAYDRFDDDDRYRLFHSAIKDYCLPKVRERVDRTRRLVAKACMQWYRRDHFCNRYDSIAGVTHALRIAAETKDPELAEEIALNDFWFWNGSARIGDVQSVVAQLTAAQKLFAPPDPRATLLAVMLAIWVRISSYIVQKPDLTFQELWNAAFWFDTPDLGQITSPFGEPSLTKPLGCLSKYAEGWRQEWESVNAGCSWMKAVVPCTPLAQSDPYVVTVVKMDLPGVMRMSCDTRGKLCVVDWRGAASIFDALTGRLEERDVAWPDGEDASTWNSQACNVSGTPACLFNVTTRSSVQVRTLGDHKVISEVDCDSPPTRLFTSADGTVVLWQCDSHLVRWNVCTGHVLRAKLPSSSSITTVSVAGDNTTVAASSDRRVYRIVFEGDLPRIAELDGLGTDADPNVRCCISLDGQRVFACDSAALYQWNGDGAPRRVELPVPIECFDRIALSPDQSHLFVAFPWAVIVVDATTLEWRSRQDISATGLNYLWLDSQHIVSDDMDCAIKVRSLVGQRSQNNEQTNHNQPKGIITSVMFSNNGDMFVTTNAGGFVSLWRDDMSRVWMRSVTFSLLGARVFGKCVAVYSEEGDCEIWALEDGRVLRSRQFNSGTVCDVYADKHGMVVAPNSGGVALYNWNWQLVDECVAEDEGPNVFFATTDGLMTWSTSGVARLWRPSTSKLTMIERIQGEDIEWSSLEALKAFANSLPSRGCQIRSEGLFNAFIGECKTVLGTVPNFWPINKDGAFAKHPTRDLWVLGGFTSSMRAYERSLVCQAAVSHGLGGGQ